MCGWNRGWRASRRKVPEIGSSRDTGRGLRDSRGQWDKEAVRGSKWWDQGAVWWFLEMLLTSILVLSSDWDKEKRTPFSGDRSSGKWPGLDINGPWLQGQSPGPGGARIT